MISANAKRSRRTVVILAVPPIEELDVVGPVSVFGGVKQISPELAYDISVVSLKKGPIRGEAGVSLVSHGRYSDVKGKVDTLLVAGGEGAEACRDPGVLRWLRATARRARRVGSICSGAFLLAEAGLLDGRRATTHWMRARRMAARFPRVTVDPVPIWTQDGNVYTSAGVSAGMDLVLELVEQDHGGEVALRLARGLVLFLRRPGGQAQFSVALAAQPTDHRGLRELQVWMAEHLTADLSVEKLAARVAMSPRNFARVFRRELGITPAHHVEQLRIESARRLLEQTDRSTDEIAAACGYSSAELLRAAFVRTVGTPPSHYREHFRHRAPRHPRPRSSAPQGK